MNTWYKRQGSQKWKSINDIKSPCVVITGGSHGLGHAIVVRFLNKVPKITIINVDKISSPQDDPRMVTIQCDLSNQVEMEKTLSLIKRKYGERIAVIINNAGMRMKYQNFQHLDQNECMRVFQLNTFNAVRFMQSLVPEENSNDRQCYIVNVASTLGTLTPAKVAGYGASKSALIAFHQSYSMELQTRRVSNIRTLLVVPGQLNTAMFSGFEAPRQFFAPVVEIGTLADQIVQKCEMGERGELNVPFYSNFAHLLMGMPYMVQIWARKFAQIDNCLPDEE